eukprot:TRINITY_DN1533_c0_g1_i4.p4 TRINITY_DN1533_c0_g1~~TRINITY_DN1533_c0_g1_i4.p4  ORF type:complete len:101 (-),score=30.79 TRINITY_DN1533_c0_g1_i4:107-409(-)
MWSVGGLTMYHLNLLSTDMTTNEDIKNTYAKRRNPNRACCLVNCVRRCFPPLYPSFVRVPRLADASARSVLPCAVLPDSVAVVVSAPEKSDTDEQAALLE